MARALITMCLSYFIFSIFGCAINRSQKRIYIFIPMDYTGWVNIIFNDTGSSEEPLIFNDGYVFLIKNNPAYFKVKSDIFPSGKYDMYYYYYNTDTTISLSWLGYPKRNIFFERTMGSKEKNKYRYSILAFSFYVSREPLDVDSLSVDKIPKNKIIE